MLAPPRVAELPAEQAAPVLEHYLKAVPVVRPFLDVTADSSIEDFIGEVSKHPVFRLSASAPN